MDEAVTSFIILFFSFVITYFIVVIIWKSFMALYEAVPADCNTDEYWNDAGDGSGVNYVQMPNGEVRID